jgi:hypothetical protein
VERQALMAAVVVMPLFIKMATPCSKLAAEGLLVEDGEPAKADSETMKVCYLKSAELFDQGYAEHQVLEQLRVNYQAEALKKEPNWLIWGAVAGSALLGGAWLLSRR